MDRDVGISFALQHADDFVRGVFVNLEPEPSAGYEHPPPCLRDGPVEADAVIVRDEQRHGGFVVADVGVHLRAVAFGHIGRVRHDRVETLRELEGLIDIYLPDMKYSNESLAAKLSRAPDYVETAKAAIQEMYQQVGSAVIEDDIMQRGRIVRHLMLPGELDNTLGVLDWFAETFPKGDVLFSLMSQYVPMEKAKELPPYNRKITEEEYDAAISYLDFLGIESGFTQDFTSATEDYIPDFSFEGLE